MEQIYMSKVDAWFIVLMAGTALLLTGAFILSLRAGNTSTVLALLPALLIGIGLPLWLFMSTNYTLNDSTLLVKSGPFSWQVPIAEVTAVTPTNNPLSSPALSLDRLRIDYGGKSIMISPKLKEEFIQDLETRRRQLLGQ